jgi:hypothetical protein
MIEAQGNLHHMLVHCEQLARVAIGRDPFWDVAGPLL